MNITIYFSGNGLEPSVKRGQEQRGLYDDVYSTEYVLHSPLGD